MAWWLEFYEDVSDGDAPARQLALFNIRVTCICFDSWRSYTLQSLREYIAELWLDLHLRRRRRAELTLYSEIDAQRAALVASASRDAAPEIYEF
jgi:hypothetical protein